MSEEEYLKKFIEFLQAHYYGIYVNEVLNKHIEDFLIEIHKRYKQVYFYEWEGKEKEIVREQIRIKLWDFLTSLELDEDSLDDKVNTYIERTI